MRVRMLTTAAGPGGVYHAGETWDLADAEAMALVRGGYAAALLTAGVALSSSQAAPETTSVRPAETAALPRAQRKRG